MSNNDHRQILLVQPFRFQYLSNLLSLTENLIDLDGPCRIIGYFILREKLMLTFLVDI